MPNGICSICSYTKCEHMQVNASVVCYEAKHDLCPALLINDERCVCSCHAAITDEMWETIRLMYQDLLNRAQDESLDR